MRSRRLLAAAAATAAVLVTGALSQPRRRRGRRPTARPSGKATDVHRARRAEEPPAPKREGRQGCRRLACCAATTRVGLLAVRARARASSLAVSESDAVVGAARDTDDRPHAGRKGRPGRGRDRSTRRRPRSAGLRRNKAAQGRDDRRHGPARRQAVGPADGAGGRARAVQAGDKRRARRHPRHRHRRAQPGPRAELRRGLSRNFVTDIPDDRRAVRVRRLRRPGRLGRLAVTARTSPARSARPRTASASPGSRRTSRWSRSAAGRTRGYFFLEPVVNALTYGADIGLDVINMSFYVDPWLYNCTAQPGRHRRRRRPSSARSSRR